EAAWIADRIAAGLTGSDRQPARRPRDYAVLCRSADQLAQPIVQALARRGIAVRMQSGEARRDPVLADALAVLTVAVALADRRPVADPPLNRLLAAALPASEFQAAMAAIRARNVTAAEYLFADAAIRTPGEAALAAELTDLAAQLPADQVFQAIRLATRWAGTAAPAAWPALRDLATAADACLRAGGTLADFLAGYTPPPTEAVTADAVAVMTVHAAKGLQFPVTFVAGLSAGIFPVAARLAPVFDFAPLREWLDGQGYRPRSESERQNAQLLEERRLFYVALTRAKEELYLSGAGTYGTVACGESPFIAELAAAGVVDRLAGASARPSAADLVGSARAYLLDLAEGRPVGTAPGLVLKRGLAARSILGAGAGAVDLVRSETAAPFRPGQGLRTSVSALETYDSCPRQFFFVHCLKLPSEAALPMSFGNALHGVLASLNNRRAERGTLPSEDELLAWWRARLAADVFVSKQQYRQYLSRGETYLRRYLAWEAEQERRLPGRQVHAVEKQFRFDYRDADGTIHEFRGRFDLILRLPDGSFEIIDYKSGQRRNINKQVRAGSRNNPDRSWQLAVYHLALADEIRADEPNPVISTTYCFLAHPGDDFGLPPAAFNDRGENVITCRHGDESLAVVRGEIDAVLRRIADNDFAAMPREPQVCEWCQFKQLCEVSKHEYR
ncbi:MAG: PD-(D/E)XK nuclease family protein, partial [Chloroflexota bacterium]